MNSSSSRNRVPAVAMLAVSMIYGALLAVMAVMSWPGVQLVAIIGGCFVGIGWLIVATLDRTSKTKAAD